MSDFYDWVNAEEFYIVEGVFVTGLESFSGGRDMSNGYNPLSSLNPTSVHGSLGERIFRNKEYAEDWMQQQEENLKKWVELYQKGKVKDCYILESKIDQEETSRQFLESNTDSKQIKPMYLFTRQVIRDFAIPRMKVIKAGEMKEGHCPKCTGFENIRWTKKLDIPLEKADAI